MRICPNGGQPLLLYPQLRCRVGLFSTLFLSPSPFPLVSSPWELSKGTDTGVRGNERWRKENLKLRSLKMGGERCGGREAGKGEERRMEKEKEVKGNTTENRKGQTEGHSSFTPSFPLLLLSSFPNLLKTASQRNPGCQSNLWSRRRATRC